MSRRNAQLPWGNRSNSSIYGGSGRGGMGRGVMLGAIVLATLVVGYFLFTRACSSTECDKFYCATDASYATPNGYQRVTQIYAYNPEKGAVPGGSNVQVQLKLEEATTDGRNLGFFRYVAESKMSLGEIAFVLGFSQPSAFFRAFKRWTGTTPSDFRAQGDRPST